MMDAAPRSGVRVAVIGGETLSPPHRRALAALLLRSGLAPQIVQPDDAEVLLSYDGTPPIDDAGRLRVHIPVAADDDIDAHTQTFLEAFDEDGRFVFARLRRREPRVRLAIDLPAVLQGIIDGRNELHAPRDEHDRFDPAALGDKRRALLSQPIADIAARAFGEAIATLLGIALPPPEWTVCASFDIDSAGMFRGRNLFRNARLVLRYHRENLIRAFSEALRSNMGLLVDPHIRLRTLGEALEGLGVPATFFVQTHRLHLLDNYNIAKAGALRRQIEAIIENEYHEVGLHGSYATRDGDAKSFLRQWKRLERTFGGNITNVHRAHYLRTPEGMNYAPPRADQPMVDSSLAFGQIQGYRRGTAYPFLASDNIIELPPAAMDSTFIYWQRFTASRTHQEVMTLMNHVRQNGGAFVLVWHPHHMEDILFRGRLDAFYDIIYEAKRSGARFRGLAAAARELYATQVTLEQHIGAPTS